MFQINFLIQMSVQFEILLLILGLAVHGQRLKKRKKGWDNVVYKIRALSDLDGMEEPLSLCIKN